MLESNKLDILKKLSIITVDKYTIKIAKSLHITIFPVVYPDFFYDDFIETGNKKCYLINYHHNDLNASIGTISIVYHTNHVYIMTFGLLEEFRRAKIGSICLSLFEKYLISIGIKKIFLHVQVINKIACSFYKKCGYRKIKKEDDYYESLSNKKAYLFYKNIKDT
ncbi:hypothetical protein H312_01334 [Anncaliia algerae PRA339]|uniref:N-acetyltransferase domain-containing protein n=1 Tax=Anncaliia algerae PRA339 TaxID=1288291 RepID=A0A059F2R4_9MICR|nr:hypothetical protein H312_01334 [Anncaliia algerae PRA339]